jgi:hypothetical protein
MNNILPYVYLLNHLKFAVAKKKLFFYRPLLQQN